MQKGDKLVILREVDIDPATSKLTQMVAALASLGIPLDEDCPYQETREMIGDTEQVVVTWVLKAKSDCGRFDTHSLIGKWNDPDFITKEPEHPLAYLKAGFTFLNRAVEVVTHQVPLALIRKGRRIALIPMDATPERREQLLKMLDQ